MAIVQGMCSQFKQDILLGIHDLDTDTLKIALYTEDADIDTSTTVYTATGEVSGTGYITGGQTLTGVSVSLSGTTAFVDFANPSWAGASFTAKGALIYNFSKSNKAIAVLNFGANKTATNTTFEIQLPANAANTAVIRIE
jgi:hypothetical protein